MVNQRSAEELFVHLDRNRGQSLTIGRTAAQLTIPSILPPEGHPKNTPLPRPYQSVGARCVNSLAAKMLLALFPTNTPFFRLVLTNDAKEEAGDQATEFNKTLSRIEADTLAELEKTNFRAKVSLALKALLVTGDSTVHIDDDGQFKEYRLDSYVVERDSTGQLIEWIGKESLSPANLKPEVLENHFTQEEQKQLQDDRESEVDIYTRMYLKDGKYHVYQELKGKEIEGTRGTYPKNAPGFIVPRWTHITGDDYGHGMVEDYLPDLQALNEYSRDLKKASSAMSKIIFALKPGSQIKKKDLSKAESGDILHGKAEDVEAIQINKFGDFRIPQETREEIKRDLFQVFLMNSAVSRDAERVTAEEIRYLAQELEDTLGGVYSVLTMELQKPMLNRYLHVLRKKKKIPELPKELVNHQITTGLEALGRSHEVNKLMTFLNQYAGVVGQEAVAQRINSTEVANRLAAGIGIEAESLIKSEEQIAEEMAAQSQEQLLQGVAPQATSAIINQTGGQDG